jgi:hypothetical protein
MSNARCLDTERVRQSVGNVVLFISLGLIQSIELFRVTKLD